MLLKIFTKRKPGGELVDKSLGWHSKYHEAETVESRIDGRKAYVTTIHKHKATLHEIDLKTHGYEVLTVNGAAVEKYATKIEEDK